jgi:pimeloyl-ACP methyl ester carboxylesterase
MMSLPDKPQADQPPVRRIKRLYLEILGLLILAIPLAGVLLLNQLADQVIFFKYGRERWAMQRPGLCSPARKQQVYADMRPGQSGVQALEYSCEAARSLPARSFYTQTADGISIHYRIFDSPKADAPLLLHVPGITSSWLDGARYAGVARRLGFQLAVLELRNHGISGNNGRGAAYGCREREDVLAVVRALQSRYPQRTMLIWASSMGSMSVINAARALEAIPAVKGLLLENFPTSLREVVETSFSPGHPALLYDAVILTAGLRHGVDFHDCSPLERVRQLELPAFVTVTRADTLTPVAMVAKAYATFPPGQGHRYKLYPHGRHAAIWNGQPKVYEADIKSFWQSLKH